MNLRRILVILVIADFILGNSDLFLSLFGISSESSGVLSAD